MSSYRLGRKEEEGVWGVSLNSKGFFPTAIFEDWRWPDIVFSADRRRRNIFRVRRPQCIEVQCLFCSGCKEILAVREFFIDRLADTFFFSIPSPEIEGGREGENPSTKKAAQTKQKQTFLRRPRTFSKKISEGRKSGSRRSSLSICSFGFFFRGAWVEVRKLTPHSVWFSFSSRLTPRSHKQATLDLNPWHFVLFPNLSGHSYKARTILTPSKKITYRITVSIASKY